MRRIQTTRETMNLKEVHIRELVPVAICTFYFWYCLELLKFMSIDISCPSVENEGEVLCD